MTSSPRPLTLIYCIVVMLRCGKVQILPIQIYYFWKKKCIWQCLYLTRLLMRWRTWGTTHITSGENIFRYYSMHGVKNIKGHLWLRPICVLKDFKILLPNWCCKEYFCLCPFIDQLMRAYKCVKMCNRLSFSLWIFLPCREQSQIYNIEHGHEICQISEYFTMSL